MSINTCVHGINDLLTNNNNYNHNNWRASETLTGVTQLKIGDVCLFVYMFGRTYVTLYFDPLVFSC